MHWNRNTICNISTTKHWKMINLCNKFRSSRLDWNTNIILGTLNAQINSSMIILAVSSVKANFSNWIDTFLKVKGRELPSKKVRSKTKGLKLSWSFDLSWFIRSLFNCQRSADVITMQLYLHAEMWRAYTKITRKLENIPQETLM